MLLLKMCRGLIPPTAVTWLPRTRTVFSNQLCPNAGISPAELFRECQLFEKSGADSHGLFEWRTLADIFSVFSAAEVPPICRGYRPGPKRTATELIYSAESATDSATDSASDIFILPKNFLSDSASEAIGPTRTHSDPGGLNRSPPRNCSATYITLPRN